MTVAPGCEVAADEDVLGMQHPHHLVAKPRGLEFDNHVLVVVTLARSVIDQAQARNTGEL